MTIKELITIGEKRLDDAGIHDASNDARELLSFVTGRDRTGLIMYINTEVSNGTAQEYYDLIEERASRVPLQHITGEQEFMGYRFKVTKDVLVPRMDTELLVEEAAKRAADAGKSTWQYTRGILQSWVRAKVLTAEDVRREDASYERRKIAAIAEKEKARGKPAYQQATASSSAPIYDPGLDIVGCITPGEDAANWKPRGDMSS